MFFLSSFLFSVLFLFVILFYYYFFVFPFFCLARKKNQSQSGHELVALEKKWQDEKGTGYAEAA